MRIDFAKAWNIFVHNLPLFQYGIEMTLLFAFVGTFAGFVVGLLVGGIRAIEINEYDSTGIKVLKRIGRIIRSILQKKGCNPRKDGLQPFIPYYI